MNRFVPEDAATIIRWMLHEKCRESDVKELVKLLLNFGALWVPMHGRGHAER